MKTIILLSLIFIQNSFASNKNLEPAEIIRRAEDNIRGSSQNGRITMEVHNGSSKREIKFDFWSKDRNKNLIKILAPQKELGSGNLRVDMNLWRYLANVDRVLKIPPSMMLQSWMGSDFTYDDLVKVSSLSTDYTHKVLQKSDAEIVIECIPKPSAPVVWGKVIETIRLDGYVTKKREFYSEKGERLKTMASGDIRKVGTHQVPFLLLMVNHKKPENKTIIKYDSLSYESVKTDAIFTEKKLKER
jgi:outer membrane lipoprotein-sorting protein